MSFYGNVIYELADAFASVKVKNSGKSNNSLADSFQDEVEIAAAGLGGEATLDTGNRWIGLTANTDDQSCKIWHREPDATSTGRSIAAIQKVETPAKENYDLSSGDYVQISSATYDKMGHINGESVTTLRMPVSKTEEDITDLQERMTAIEDSDVKQTEHIDEVASGFQGLQNSYDGLDERVTANTNNITNKVGSNAKYCFQSDKSLYTFLGASIEKYIQENLKAYTVKEAFSKIKEIADGASSTATSTNLVLDIVIKNLCAQLEEQLAEQGINISIDQSALKKSDTTDEAE